MLAFSIDYYGIFFWATQFVELFCTYDQVNFAVYVPKIDEHFVGSLAVVPLQLMGYYVSVAKGLDVDKPRNLAKSVTVE